MILCFEVYALANLYYNAHHNIVSHSINQDVVASYRYTTAFSLSFLLRYVATLHIINSSNLA